MVSPVVAIPMDTLTPCQRLLHFTSTKAKQVKKKRTPCHSLESIGMRLQLTGLAPARSGGLSLTL